MEKVLGRPHAGAGAGAGPAYVHAPPAAACVRTLLKAAARARERHNAEGAEQGNYRGTRTGIHPRSYLRLLRQISSF